ncbi:hypothetical protein MMC07_003943 [Pseudocyphellaria aurata]|nr:hypothetical protein [Pseudocyphellaria aurata]
MASTTALRFFSPRGGYISKYNYLGIGRPLHGNRQQPNGYRYASTTAPPPTKPVRKPRVLEKPTKFTPPSHPARINRPTPRHFPGPMMSPEQTIARKTKKYPHMMPPEGSFMYWFLTNKGIHMWFCLSVLFCLAMTTLVKDFRRKTHYFHMLPPGKYFFEHPISFIYQIYEVSIMDAKRDTEINLAKRKKNQEDVEKRKAWRKAHGLDRPNPGIFPCFGLAEEEEGKSGEKEGQKASSEEQNGAVEAASSTDEPSSTTSAAAAGEATSPAAEDGSYVDWEGRRRRPPVKRWLGIWT